MLKTILITGSTDGIGLETAKKLLSEGHTVLLHGRNPAKLEGVEKNLTPLADGGKRLQSYVADLSDLAAVEKMAKQVMDQNASLDVLINNAGVYNPSKSVTPTGLDMTFVVNTIAPYLLAKRLLPIIPASGRIVNLSSAAQAPVNLDALLGRARISDPFNNYAQSKLALTMWSRSLAQALGPDGPVVVAVNPGSMLGTKMVRNGFGVSGNDVGIGVDILTRAALSDEFAKATGLYFDNDSRQFASPHPEGLNSEKSDEVVRLIEGILPT